MTQNSTIVAKYKCNVGFSMKDSEFRHCSPEGIFDLESQQKIYNKWTGNKPECIGRKKCTFHKIFQLEIFQFILQNWKRSQTFTSSLDIDDCDANQCENGGTCQDEINAYSCVCAPGYTGNNCEIGNDFLFIIDCTYLKLK